MSKKKKIDRVNKFIPQSKPYVLYIFIVVLFILSIITLLQPQRLDYRNQAQEITPTITPLLRCNVPCTFNSQCPTGLACTDGSCRNPACPSRANCSCILTPTSLPAGSQPTRFPTRSMLEPTSIPIPTKRLNEQITPTPLPTSIIFFSPTPVKTFPTIQISPTPMFEAYGREPGKMSLFDAIVRYVGDVFCKLFRLC